MDSADRAAQAAASKAAGAAGGVAGTYGAQAGQIAGFEVPTLERFATTPPGFSPTGLAQMESTAQEAGAGVSAGLQHSAAMRAMRSRNVAGVGGQQDAIAQAAARAQGQDIQGILGANEKLKAQQQEMALRGLGEMYGTAERGQAAGLGAQAEDIRNRIAAGSVGWMQNLEGILGATDKAAAAGIQKA